MFRCKIFILAGLFSTFFESAVAHEFIYENIEQIAGKNPVFVINVRPAQAVKETGMLFISFDSLSDGGVIFHLGGTSFAKNISDISGISYSETLHSLTIKYSTDGRDFACEKIFHVDNNSARKLANFLKKNNVKIDFVEVNK